MAAAKGTCFFLPLCGGLDYCPDCRTYGAVFEEKVKIKRKVGSAFVIIGGDCPCCSSDLWVGAQLINQIVGLIGALPGMWAGIGIGFFQYRQEPERYFGKTSGGYADEAE